MLGELTNHIRTLYSALLLLTLAGCNSLGPTCTTEAPPAIHVSVEHAEFGEPIDDALVVVKDGSFADSARTDAAGPGGPHFWVSFASERPGTYTVRAEKSGFVDWIREDVTATEGRCHVNTVQLRAHLVLESS